ncbi:MAG: hypothetical protein HYU37_21890 [Acidobacteria bacterium]|nr:hypothetical protein [Acidobacteriota bacterium]
MGSRLFTLAVVVLMVAPFLAGQTRYTPPRMPDGQPDLQGYWTNAGYAPLERPDNVTKEFYTPEEAAGFERQFVDREAEQTVPGTIPDVHYDHTQFGLDRSVAGYSPNLRTSLIVDPTNGKLPPLSAKGQRRAAERAEAVRRQGGPYDAVQNVNLATRCIVMDRMAPPMLYGNYNNTYQIVQAPGYVMILAEMLHDYRVIPLDGRPQLESDVRQWIGSGRGRWDGETLVVETTNFNGKNPFRGSSENMRLIERFTRVDENTIRYQFTVDDPDTWTRPWSAEMPMKKTVGPIFEHACHEGNYGLYNILAGARADEKRAQEAAKKGSR